jgi:16S rRNA (guanine527-N7)-methyltransferase
MINGIPSILNAFQVHQLETLVDVFLEWNGKLNLSSFSDRKSVEMKHVVDSLGVYSFDLIKKGDRVLDLGTGGGFPGLPLAIAYPDCNFVLVDATDKKVRAVEQMAGDLGLTNVTCMQGRAEALGQDAQFREQFNVVVARALAPPTVLMEYALPFVTVGGTFVAYQGPDIVDKIDEIQRAVPLLGGTFSKIESFLLPDDSGKRVFVVITKTSRTKADFPRKDGIPRKKPL